MKFVADAGAVRFHCARVNIKFSRYDSGRLTLGDHG